MEEPTPSKATCSHLTPSEQEALALVLAGDESCNCLLYTSPAPARRTEGGCGRVGVCAGGSSRSAARSAGGADNRSALAGRCGPPVQLAGHLAKIRSLYSALHKNPQPNAIMETVGRCDQLNFSDERHNYSALPRICTSFAPRNVAASATLTLSTMDLVGVGKRSWLHFGRK